MIQHEKATAIHAIPARRIERGFRLLVLREFRAEGAPPAFAFIEQSLLRSPERRNRHGLSFASALVSEVVTWLSEHVGRPSLREGSEPPQRNPRWPTLHWHRKDRVWTDGTGTVEWYVDIICADDASARAFERRWSDRLDGSSPVREPPQP